MVSPCAMLHNIDFKCNNVALKIGVERLVWYHSKLGNISWQKRRHSHHLTAYAYGVYADALLEKNSPLAFNNSKIYQIGAFKKTVYRQVFPKFVVCNHVFLKLQQLVVWFLIIRRHHIQAQAGYQYSYLHFATSIKKIIIIKSMRELTCTLKGTIAFLITGFES